MMGGKQTGDAAGMKMDIREAQPDPADQDDQDSAGGQEVTPEEQDAYNRYVQAAMEIVYPEGQQQGGDDPVAPEVMANLRGQFDEQTQQRFQQAQPPLRSEAPMDQLAVATVSVLLQIEDILGDGSQDLQDAIVYHGGKEIMEQLTDVADAANIHDFTPREQEGAFYRGIDLYRISSKRVDQAQLKQDFDKIVQADRDGTIDQVLPGFKDAAEHTNIEKPDADQPPAAEPQPQDEEEPA